MAPKRKATAKESADGAEASDSRGTRGDVLSGRPDLATDSLADLRTQQRALKTEAKRVAADLRNKRRQKKRAMKRCATLDTRDLVQVLLDRGVQLQKDAAASSAAASRPNASEPAAKAADGHDGARDGTGEEPSAGRNASGAAGAN